MAQTPVSSAPVGVDSSRAALPSQARLLLNLQRVNKIAQRLSGCLEIETIARFVTDGLVDQFGCAFARIWVVEPNQTMLRLVASSGLYTHTDGSFAQVPMGAYKVGKIAQNRVPFLSNHLADEAWVKDRDWAIANNIQGFAGYPLMTGDRVIGVLATFSHSPMAAEFLEVLQVLCMTATVALDAALSVKVKSPGSAVSAALSQPLPLSDQLATILKSTTMALVGTEVLLPVSINHIFVQLAELLDALYCDYARLVYGSTGVLLEAIVAVPEAEGDPSAQQLAARWRSRCHQLQFMATCLGGGLQTQPGPQQQLVQITLQVPYSGGPYGPKVSIQCEAVLVQVALTCLVYKARLTLADPVDPETVIITNSASLVQGAANVIWVRVNAFSAPPAQVKAVIDWTVTADQLCQVVQLVHQGQWVEAIATPPGSPRPSEREREIMALLARGLRDRDIANQLYISESTVKFHINNSLTKLQAKNRYQAVYQAAIHGWI
ncbi:LuxR C-terminal-related transcriptional regulator [Nodosilinea sp. E11]|uniref:LuxR C-terminal-related transcriptional regulator n=1 Tax=Nodosilinea sp. E11 TaxID=3037479 RepID=UPI002934B9FF|nr:GAF domain-containing protein [Nodosilinea sp. E11]WOD37729.1 LuxR C-terminal-related transcriptional regulator [Nodosilinea sp. E11]